jgi:choline dehydrogenase
MNRPLTAITSFLQYVFRGTGLFLSPVAEYSYFFRSDRFPPRPLSESENDAFRPENLPDLEIANVGAWGTAEEPTPKVQNKYGFNTILVQLTRPQSEGTVTLVDRDARTPAIVDPNYLSSQLDLETIRQGVHYGLEIGQKIMEKSNDIKKALVPENSSQESVDKFIRKHLTGAYHLSSTCRMAKRENDGVVDQFLQVHGIQGLRIADASIFPRLVGVKPQATVVMVAEKCAEIILGRE